MSTERPNVNASATQCGEVQRLTEGAAGTPTAPSSPKRSRRLFVAASEPVRNVPLVTRRRVGEDGGSPVFRREPRCGIVVGQSFKGGFRC